MSKRKICVVTGTRAEYGLLSGLMQLIQDDEALQLQLVVTGMHLAPQYGLTYQEIERDGFIINEKVEMLLAGDTPVSVTKSVGIALLGFADAYQRLKPDILVVLGDRTEIFAAAQAALLARIPIAHLHGGELTEGAFDDAIRHSITKMAHLHFVAAEPYRRRVIQLGEEPDRVMNVGALGIENIRRLKLRNKQTLESILGISFGRRNFLVTYHPVTLEVGKAANVMKELLEALDHYPDAQIFITKPNSDPEGLDIIRTIDQFAALQPNRVKVFASLGQLNYFSMIEQCDLVIGNSSSGLIEVPSFHKPTINMGNRQKGRLKAESVIDCGETKEAIVEAIEMALSSEFQLKLPLVKSPYGEGESSRQIINRLKETEIESLLFKHFYDL